MFFLFHRYWIKLFPVHFDVDDRLHSMIRQFSAQLDQEGQTEWARWLDLSEIPSYDWLRNNSIKEGDGCSSRPYRKVSLIFNHLEPDELAHLVTYLDHKIMRRITVNKIGYQIEFIIYTNKKNPLLIIHQCQHHLYHVSAYLSSSTRKCFTLLILFTYIHPRTFDTHTRTI